MGNDSVSNVTKMSLKYLLQIILDKLVVLCNKFSIQAVYDTVPSFRFIYFIVKFMCWYDLYDVSPGNQGGQNRASELL